MAKSDFIPRSDAQFIIWHNQFREALASVGASVGVTAADLQAVSSDNTALTAAVGRAASASAAALQANNQKTVTRSTVEANVRFLARQIKAQKGYSTALGQQLGLEGVSATIDLSAARPRLTATAQPHGVVELQFNKSQSDGVNLYASREGDAGFVFLARDTASPYVDNRPLLVAGKPEVRQYKAIYVVNDAEIGQSSAEVTVTVAP
jgi:hypothetical protein